MNQSGRSVATHGYDNQAPSMQATFIASGPSFQNKLIARPFDNVQVYGLLACMLGLKPAKTDGNIDSVQYMLTKTCSQ
jgi:alkaline phosphatase D